MKKVGISAGGIFALILGVVITVIAVKNSVGKAKFIINNE